MHEKIIDIQNSFWKAYKDFGKSRDMEEYNKDIDVILRKYQFNRPMLQFCQTLGATWTSVVNEFGDGMHEKIMDIQNSFWKAYTDFCKSLDMAKYNEDIDVIFHKYRFDPPMPQFCLNLIFAWAPVVNGLKEWSL